MNLPGAVRRRLDARKRRRTVRDIETALDGAYERAGSLQIVADRDRIVIFSDHHKGARDGADDFQRCERGYNAALAYYNHLGYHLIELGDVEELWENPFEKVADAYPRTLALAAAFQDARRYTRLWGNHDLVWKDTARFRERMGRYGYGDVEPVEALRLVVADSNGTRQGELFLVHGHQGTADSDRNAKLSQWLVRNGWTRIQKLLDRPWNTPSIDWALRGEHASTMASWATARKRVLVAGHTHLPVFFESVKKPAASPQEVADPASVSAEGDRAEALRLAWREWAEAEHERLRLQQPTPLTTPCYFNTGCCAFGDGDITGIEISDGEIRLVRWPCDPATDRHVLGTPMALVDVFARTM